jgi:predicted DCC family thiol-disulfide oxidoreductase YuxK
LVLFDGHCAFCRAQARRLASWTAGGAPVTMRDFQEAGALDAFPGLTHAECMKAMQLVTPDGRVYPGAEAAARLVAMRAWGVFAWLYYIPGIRWLCDRVYAWIARNRYRLAKKRREASCDGNACDVHFD